MGKIALHVPEDIMVRAARQVVEETGVGIDNWGESECVKCRSLCGSSYLHLESDIFRTEAGRHRRNGKMRSGSPQARRGQKKPDGYDQFLKSEEWEMVKKRAQRFWQDVFGEICCVMCSRKTDIEWHHRHYNKPLGQEGITDVVPCCRICHARHHEKD